MRIEDHHLPLLLQLNHPTRLQSVANHDEAQKHGSYSSLHSLPTRRRISLSFPRNSLHNLHPRLFDLQNLRTLDLARNRLTDVPSALARIPSLKELNLSDNKLRWLPYCFRRWSFFNQHLYVDNNPFYQGEGLKSGFLRWLTFDISADPRVVPPHSCFAGPDYHTNLGPDLEGEGLSCFVASKLASQPSTKCRLVGHMAVSYFDDTGRLLPGSPPPLTAPGSSRPLVITLDDGNFRVPDPNHWFVPTSVGNGMRSLLSCSMKTLVEGTKSWSALQRVLDPEADLPATIARALRSAYDEPSLRQRYRELPRCDICSRSYTVAHAEYTEFGFVGGRAFVPFRVRLCSWACVPSNRRDKPVHPWPIDPAYAATVKKAQRDDQPF